jgi:hypothetical protein
MTGYQDLQELANTYQQVSLRKVRLQHAIANHHLPMYFPEAERYLHSSRAEWFTDLLLLTPCPAAVQRYSKAAFMATVGERVIGRKVDKARWLSDFYETAQTSVGLPVAEDTEAIRMFRLVLEEYQHLCRRRKQLEADIVHRLAGHPDFDRLQTVPGIGPILALIILAESRDLRRFGHVRQFLKYCGFDLCTEQSGQFRGTTHLSKRRNARLRYAFWMAGAVAIRMQQNSFRRKFEEYMRPDPPERRSATQSLHGRGGEDGPRRLRRDHLRHRLSSLPRGDETRRSDPFVAVRGGVPDDLVDNARTFRLDTNAV